MTLESVVPDKPNGMDLFWIPAMSSEIERLSSSARLLLTAQRRRLSDVTIEEAELLRHWWQQSIDEDGNVNYNLLECPRQDA
jgi:hypothetical protein